MSHFYGYVRGSRGDATRGGSKNSGYVATAASWQGSVRVWLSHDEETGQDIATVTLAPWHGRGISRDLFSGPVSGDQRKRATEAPQP